jgi:DNA polymerase III sliding clamp (beta) subunit (PCNA family)
MNQTIKVSVADIRSFKKNSSRITSKGVIPILDYIKFDNGAITKTNINEFVVQESNFSGAFLVEERILFNFIEYTSAAEVLFVADGKKVIISDGSQKTSSSQGDISLFPEIEQPPKETVSLTDTILKLFGSAAKYTQEGNDDLRKSHIFIGGDTLMASDGFIAFYRKIDRELPKTAIPRSVAEKVSSIDPADFSQTEKKLFFRAGKTLYGFQKTEATYIDMSSFFNYKKDSSFHAPKSELIAFNEMSLAMSKLKLCHPYLEIVNGKLLMSAVNSDYGVDNEKEIDVIGEMGDKFQYDAVILNRLLKTAPDEELTFSRVKGKMYITGDSGFTSLIMELL